MDLNTESRDRAGLMGPADVAKYLGMTERTIYLWAQQKKLPAFKVGSVWRFRRSDVERWLESNRSGPSSDDVEPLSTYIEPNRSKWRIRKDEQEADTAIEEACKAYIMTTIQDVDREVFVINHFEERFGQDVVKTVVEQMKKEKKVREGQHEGLDGEKVRIIRRRN